MLILNEIKTSLILVVQFQEYDVNDDISYADSKDNEDNSILRWLVNEDGQQRYNAYFEIEGNGQPDIKLLKLYKNILLYYDNEYNDYCLIDLDEHKDPSRLEDDKDVKDVKGDKGDKDDNYCLDHKDPFRLKQLGHSERFSIKENLIGFLPDDNDSDGYGYLFVISLNNEKAKDYKIYLYSLKDFKKDKSTWKCSQQYDIESANGDRFDYCFVYQTKLFLFNGFQLMTQFDLLMKNKQYLLTRKDKQYLSMRKDKQYFLLRNYYDMRKYYDSHPPKANIVINKSQTLVALDICGRVNIFSMEKEIWISRYDVEGYLPIEFITLKDDSEGLMIYNCETQKCKLLDPFHPSDAIDIINDIKNNSVNNNQNTIIITKSHEKFYIRKNNDWITNRLEKDTFQKMLNKTYHSNIYTRPIFNTIKNMFNMLEDENFDFTKNHEINGELFRFNIESKNSEGRITIKGFKKFQNNEKETDSHHYTDVLSYKQLNNQDLALITRDEILIYTIEDEGFLGLRYCRYYSNKNEILNDSSDNESNSSSLPSPDFLYLFNKIVEYRENKNKKAEYEKYEKYFFSIINNPVEFSKFYLEMLSSVIKCEKYGEKYGEKYEKYGEKYHFIVQSIFDKVFELFEKGPEYSSYMFDLNLFDLSNHYHSNLVMKYISCTSLILDPTCSSIIDSTSPYEAYSRDIYIKETTYIRRLMKSFSKYTIKRNKTPAIRVIVPFSEFCTYDDKDESFWNKILNEDKSFLFSNIDTGNFYRWWNLAAIIDFKWRTFGKAYYLIIWFFYIIFFLFFILASTSKNASEFGVEQYYSLSDIKLNSTALDSFFIISSIFGLIQLIFEVRQCIILDPRNYFSDPWNYLDIGAYSLPIITSMYFITIKYGDVDSSYYADATTSIDYYEMIKGFRAISNLLLSFKFLIFFRVFQLCGTYFAIIIGVPRKVFPFLIVLVFLLFGFSSAFFILQSDNNVTSSTSPNFFYDPNATDYNPWNSATVYHTVHSDGTIEPKPSLIEDYNSNKNLFNLFTSSLLSVYLLLIGNPEAFSADTYSDSTLVAILLALLTFLILYLMNLFIGLLNLAINDYNKYEEFFLQQAQIIREIELIYMTTRQRKKKRRNPRWVYYDIPVEEVRKLIHAIDNKKTYFIYHPIFISKRLRNLLGIQEPAEEERKQQIIDLKKQNKKLEKRNKKLEEQNENLEEQNKKLKEQNQKLVNE